MDPGFVGGGVEAEPAGRSFGAQQLVPALPGAQKLRTHSRPLTELAYAEVTAGPFHPDTVQKLKRNLNNLLTKGSQGSNLSTNTRQTLYKEVRK